MAGSAQGRFCELQVAAHCILLCESPVKSGSATIMSSAITRNPGRSRVCRTEEGKARPVNALFCKIRLGTPDDSEHDVTV